MADIHNPTYSANQMNYGYGVRCRVDAYNQLLICEEEIDGKWVEFQRYNEMSNDYAYTDARIVCMMKAKERKEKKQ